MSKDSGKVIRGGVVFNDTGDGVSLWGKILSGAGSLAKVLGRYTLDTLSNLPNHDYGYANSRSGRSSGYGKQGGNANIDISPIASVPKVQSQPYHQYSRRPSNTASHYPAAAQQHQYQKPHVPYQQHKGSTQASNTPALTAYAKQRSLNGQSFETTPTRPVDRHERYAPDPVRRDIQRMKREGGLDTPTANTLLARQNAKTAIQPQANQLFNTSNLAHNTPYSSYQSIIPQQHKKAKRHIVTTLQDLERSDAANRIIKGPQGRELFNLPGIRNYKHPKTPYLDRHSYSDVTNNFIIYRNFILKELQNMPFGIDMSAAAEKFFPKHIWDLKGQLGIPKPGEWAIYKGELVHDAYLANNIFGQACHYMGISLEDSLLIAQRLSMATRHKPDQPEDQEAIISGWTEYSTGNPWPPGVFKPIDFDKAKKH